MVLEEIAWREPGAAFAPFAAEPGAALLDAGALALGARWSFLCVRPVTTLEWRSGQTLRDGSASAGSPFAALAMLHENRRRRGGGGPPLQSGVVGFAGYECGALVEPSAPALRAPGRLPDLAFAAYDAVAAFDRRERRAYISAPTARAAHDLERQLGEARAPAFPLALRFAGSNVSAARHRAGVEEVKRRIRDGAIYQANISHRLAFEADREIDAFDLFVRAAANASAAHAAFLNLGETQIVSASPERFFSITHEAGARIIRAEPIKGTRPRGATRDEDAQLAAALLASAKDRAENIMIADLARNDLSRIASDGSIREDAICELMTLADVHHLVSRISGRLQDGVGAVEAMRALFPCGSITGAPKVEAMRTIAAIEGTARGPYCGAIGYLDDRGGADFSVAIRTATVDGRRVTLPVGGGVTLRSDPDAEFQETLDKAAWFLAPLGLKRSDIA